MQDSVLDEDFLESELWCERQAKMSGSNYGFSQYVFHLILEYEPYILFTIDHSMIGQ